MKGTLAAAVAVLSLSLACPVLAGFYIQEGDLEFPQDVSAYWFQGGKARVDGALEGLSVIIDLQKGEGWLVESRSKRYAGGRIADLGRILRKIDVGLGSAEPPGAAAANKGSAAATKPLAVEIRDLGDGGRLLGYDTVHYQVLVDGELLEELWLAPKIRVASEIDLAAFGSAMQNMIGGGAGLNQGYEGSEAYLNLRTSGYPLRQVLFFVGEKTMIEVTSVTIGDLPPSDFAVPKGFLKIEYEDLLLGEGE